MTGAKSQAVALWKLLETGARVPRGTAHIVADARLCAVMAREPGLPGEVLFEVFSGLPVKQAHAVSKWACALPEEERLNALRWWHAKNKGGRVA